MFSRIKNGVRKLYHIFWGNINISVEEIKQEFINDVKKEFFYNRNYHRYFNCNKEQELQILYLDHYNLKEWGELNFKYPTDSCFDLRAAVKVDCFSYPNDVLLIETGIKMKIPEGYEAVIRPRSGLGKHGVTINYGTIDENYRGELKIIMFNVGVDRITIHPGDRIAQCKIQKKANFKLVKVDKFDDVTDRDENGFGSTGIK